MKKSLTRLFLAAFAISILTASLISFNRSGSDTNYEAEVYSEKLLSSPDDLVVPSVEIKPAVNVKNNLSELGNAPTVTVSEDYVIIHGSSGADANTLSDLLWKKYKLDILFKKDTAQATAYEILAGSTNRPLSSELKVLVDEAAGSDNYAWGYAVKDGKLAFYSSGKYGSERIFEEFEGLLFGEEAFSFKEGLLVVKSKNIAEHEEELALLAEAEKIIALKERWAAVLKANSEFTLDDFGGSFTTDLTELTGKSYPEPDYYPPLGQHPKVNVNSEMLDDIAAALENTAFKNTIDKIFELAETDFDGKFPDTASLGLTYNYGDGSLLGIIEAKAFMYLITGNELYGMEAIVAVKNAMLTMITNKDQFIDPFRAYGLLMMIAAETYDWCYDLMTEADKQQFLAGIEHKVCLWDPANGIYNMEIGFPPTLLNGTNGHGTSVMLMRDYLSFAAAIYDDYPEWWNFIAGRFYAEFTADFDFYFQSGMIHQGTACYAPNKLYTYLWSCWIIKTLGGNLPFKNDIDKVCLSLLGHMLPNGRLFETGDGTVFGYGATNGISYQCCLMSAALFKNEALAYYGQQYSNNYSSFTCGVGSNQWTPVMSIIFLSNGVEFNENSGNQLPLVQYNGFPLGQLIVRNAWQSDAAAVFMKIGELNAGNHDHKDSGTFQIYYKGILTGTSGCYDGDNYGNDHWKYYNQATVSKNGLLVFDPELSESEPKFDASGKLTNSAAFLYTGSQRPNIDFQEVTKQTAVAYGYTQDGSGVEYAYIAGELSGAYDYKTVKFMERNMLTVYTENPDFPMFFFVFDDIVSTKEIHVKKYLLHAKTEPTLSDEDGDGRNETITIDNGEGKLVNTTLLGGDDLTAIGGKGHAFEINGFNVTNYDKVTQKWAENDYYDRMWGRVEVSTSGSLESRLLNVIYVTDSKNGETLTPELIENEKVAGAMIADTVAVFTKGVDKISEEFSFTASGEGALKYHVAGLRRGTWKVYSNGAYLGSVYSTEESSMVRFNAQAGEITFKPGDDILPTDAGLIRFELAGGSLPSGTKDFYKYDEETPLPPTVTRGNDTFLGWYLDAEFTTPIKAIPGDTRGPITVYAKYRSTLAKDNYDTSINGYNVWAHTTDGGTITPTAKNSSLASISENTVTFIFKIASANGAAILSSDCRLSVFNSTKCSLFTTTANGDIKLRGRSVIANIATPEEFVTLRLVVDFENSVVHAYDEHGNVTHTEAMGLDGMAFKEKLTEQIFNWRASSAGTLLIDEYEVIEGNIFEMEIDPNTCVHRDANDDLACDRCRTEFDDGCDHRDANDDEKCDKCQENFTDKCDMHRDANDDGLCDICEKTYEDGCEACRDKDDDGRCDRCGKQFTDECDIHRDADDDGICDKVGCGKEFTDGCDHRDEDDDGLCDKCGETHEDGCEVCRDKNDDLKCDRCGDAFDDGTEVEGEHRIVYILGEATLPEGAPEKFTEGSTVPLPTPTLKGYRFVGWYTDKALTNQTFAVPESASDIYVVYPKFSYILADVSFEGGQNSQMSFNTEGGKATLSYVTDANYPYAVINASDAGPNAMLKKNTLSFKEMTSSQASIVVTLAKNGDDTVAPVTARTYVANKPKITFFRTTSEGDVIFGSYTLATLGEDFVTIRILIDFAEEKLHAYDGYGEILYTRSFTYDQTFSGSGEDYRKMFSSELMQFRVGGAGSIRIGDIEVYEGNVFDAKINPATCSHMDVNDDSLCDICGTAFDDGCDKHRDENDDGLCDKCGAPHEDGCEVCRDKNDDLRCDRCGKDFDDGEELPDGQYKIIYKLGEDATLSEGAPDRYVAGERLEITATATASNATFVGWYFDEALTTPAKEISSNTTGAVTLYPKWAHKVYSNSFDNEVSKSFNYPYDAENVNVGATTVEGFWLGDKVSARMEASGGKLFFQTLANSSNTLGQGPALTVSSNPYTVLKDSVEKTITYVVKLARATDDPLTEADESKFMPLVIRIGDSAVAKGISSSTTWLNIISTTTAGEVKLGNTVIATIGTEVTEIRFALDFKSGVISAYDEDGNIVTKEFSAPTSKAYTDAGIYTTEDWLGIMQNQLLQIRTSGEGTVIYDEVSIYSENLVN